MKLRTFVSSLLLCLIPLLSQAAPPAPIYFGYDGDAGLGTGKFHFDELVSVLNRVQPSTVAQALDAMAREYPDFFGFHALVYQSQSLQGATPTSPRAIVYGRDARLILAFTHLAADGKPQFGYDSIEISRFDDLTRTFDFREIRFRDDAHSPDDAYPAGGKPFLISAPNSAVTEPGRCQTCHGESIRPNWNAYSTWPGVYGSLDDFRNPESTSTQEYRDYQTFIHSASTRDRYRVLTSNSLSNRPNHDLGILLTGLNSQRIVQDLAHRPEVRKRRYALLHALVCLENDIGTTSIPLTAEPNSPVLDFESLPRPLNAIEKMTRTAMSSDLGQRFKDVAATTQLPVEHLLDTYSAYALPATASALGLPTTDPVNVFVTAGLGLRRVLAVAQVRALLEPMGINVGNWSLAFGERSYVFDEPGANAITPEIRLNLAHRLLPVLLTTPSDQALAQDLLPWTGMMDFDSNTADHARLDALCGQLEVLDQQARER